MAAAATASSSICNRIYNLYFTPSSFSINTKFPPRPISQKPLNLNLKPQFVNSTPLSLYHLRLASAAFDGFEVAQDSTSAQQEDPEAEPFEKSEEEEEEQKVSHSNEAGRLYVGNLPFSMTSSQLSEIFQEAGNVVSVEIVYDRVTDRSRGFAFVTMGSAEDAKEAIRMFDGSQIGGRTVKVNFPEVPRGGERLVMGPKVRSNYRGFIDSPHKIYAGNLGWGLTSEGLRDAFAGQPGFLSAKASWFSMSDNGDGTYTYTEGNERIPDNWYRRAIEYPYDNEYFFLDVINAAALHPKFVDVGGNMGTTNSFAGVDVGNLTGGVINSGNLLQGNNLACLAYQASAQVKPDVALTALNQLTDALGQISSQLSCPQLSAIDESQLEMFPGYSKSNVASNSILGGVNL